MGQRFVGPVLVLSSSILFGCCQNARGTDEKPAAVSRRSLPAADLQRWYGKELDLKGDETLAQRVQEAERLLDDLFDSQETPARTKLVERVLGLSLPPQVLRAVVKCGHVPVGEARGEGYVQGQAAVPGFPGKQMAVTVRIPRGYTHDRPWPLIIDLHGSHGNGNNYIKHWENGVKPGALDQFLIVAPTSDGAHGWGASSFGRAHVLGALRWAERQYRVDADRVYLSGGSMGGSGAKIAAVLHPDWFAAAVSRSGSPLPAVDTATYRNLHALPFLVLSGDQDHGIPVALLKQEQEALAQAHLPARVEIMPGRGHEGFDERNGEILEYFLKQSRERCPAKLDYVSLEEGPPPRHYWIEAARFISAGNAPVTKYVLDAGRTKDPLFEKLQAAKALAEHQALAQEALRTGLILEEKKAWSRPREVTLTADRATNTITIEKARFVWELRILLDDELLDLDRPIAVKQGGTTLLKRAVARAPRFLLEEALRSGRRDMPWWGQVTVTPQNTPGAN